MLQTHIKNRLIRRGIVAVAVLAALPGTLVAAEQTFDEAVAAYERGDYATAMRGFRVHAEQGNAEAQLNLGVMYANSLGVPEDDAEAARWFRKAAEQGDFAALRALAARGDYDTAMQGAAYAKAVREHVPQAQILFDRFHLVQHLNRAVDEVRRAQMRQLSRREKVQFKGVRYLLLKNPWNLKPDQKERLSTLVRWNTPITRAYYLKESFQLFFEYKQPKRAREHLERWMHAAMRSRLEPFKKLVRMLRGHLDGVLAWTKLRLSNGALEGMNNKIKLVSHRAFGFRSVEHYVAAIYHCCAQLPLPQQS